MREANVAGACCGQWKEGGDKHKGECGGSGLCVGGQENRLFSLISLRAVKTVITLCFLQFAA